jgi:hypothetical protein
LQCRWERQAHRLLAHGALQWTKKSCDTLELDAEKYAGFIGYKYGSKSMLNVYYDHSQSKEY